MKAKSIKGASPTEIQTALQESMADGFAPTLAIVFISIIQDRQAVCDFLRDHGMDILGATSAGEFTDGYQGAGSTVILLLDLPRDSYAVLLEEIGDREVKEAAGHLVSAAKQRFVAPAFILCSSGITNEGVMFEGNTLMQSLEEVLGPEAHIYGGMAGDDITFTGSYVFTHDKESEWGIAALVLNEEKITLHGMAISGWNPIGILRTITRIEDGWIYMIDDKPALEMYFKYLGDESTTAEDTFKMFKEIGIFYPFQVEEAGDPVMRTPILIDREKNALKLDFDVPQGTKFRFSTPPDFDIVDNVIEKARELKTASQAEAEALLIFSCAGRLNALGPMTQMENEGLSETWDAPMAGFFTYGEYGTAHGKQEFHSTTCSWVALKEK